MKNKITTEKLKLLRNTFVVAPIDKASGNIAFV